MMILAVAILIFLGILAFLAPKTHRWAAAAMYIIAAPAYFAFAYYLYVQYQNWMILTLSLCIGAVGGLSLVKAGENLFG